MASVFRTGLLYFFPFKPVTYYPADEWLFCYLHQVLCEVVRFFFFCLFFPQISVLNFKDSITLRIRVIFFPEACSFFLFFFVSDAMFRAPFYSFISGVLAHKEDGVFFSHHYLLQIVTLIVSNLCLSVTCPKGQVLRMVIFKRFYLIQGFSFLRFSSPISPHVVRIRFWIDRSLRKWVSDALLFSTSSRKIQ